MTIRGALFSDFLEEGWPSMDLCAEMLTRCWPQAMEWIIEERRPAYRTSFGRVPIVGTNKIARNVDRLFNRWWTYPTHIGKHRNDFDFFHIVDHSYAHLVHSLPTSKTGVYCHDLDAFRCLTQPERETRPWWFRKMSQRILSGMQAASVVFYSTKAVHADMLRFGLLDPAKLVHAPYGVDASFSIAQHELETPAELKKLSSVPWLLHVGATIPRKRIDILLRVFAAARNRVPNLHLCKIGGTWTSEQETQIRKDNLQRSIVHLGKVSQSLLVDTYRRTSAVMLTSDAEGFGLPVIEAMACGAPVIASDIPVLRESGGTGAVFAPVGDIEAWCDAVTKVIGGDSTLPSRDTRLAWAAQFSWAEHARIIADAYQKLL